MVVSIVSLTLSLANQKTRGGCGYKLSGCGYKLSGCGYKLSGCGLLIGIAEMMMVRPLAVPSQGLEVGHQEPANRMLLLVLLLDLIKGFRLLRK